MNQHSKISVVLFNMSTYREWENGVVNRNYFIFKQLEQDKRIDKILAIDYLPYNFKRSIKYIFQNGSVGKLTKKSDKLYVLSTSQSFWSRNKLVEKIKASIEKAGIKNFITWSYLPTFTEYFGTLGAKLSIFEAVDDWSQHNSYQAISEKLIKNYKTIEAKADIIFTVSPILNDLFSNHQNVHWIPNGVDYHHFQDKNEIPKELENIKKPIIGYIGTIQSRVDLDLIKYLADKNPDKLIVLVGPIWSDADISKLDGLKNVYLIGRVPYSLSPTYINQFDVGIVPHTSKGFVKTMNPMKIYEYLACGKPIVSNAMFGFDALVEYIKITNSYDEFNLLINREIESDNEEKIQKRRTASQRNSWQSRYQKMWEIIGNKL